MGRNPEGESEGNRRETLRPGLEDLGTRLDLEWAPGILG